MYVLAFNVLFLNLFNMLRAYQYWKIQYLDSTKHTFTLAFQYKILHFGNRDEKIVHVFMFVGIAE